MIEIRATCHIAARAEAIERNGGRPVYIACVYRHEGERTCRFVFRATMSGGCA